MTSNQIFWYYYYSKTPQTKFNKNVIIKTIFFKEPGIHWNMKPDCHFIQGKEENAAPFSSPEKVKNIFKFDKIWGFSSK